MILENGSAFRRSEILSTIFVTIAPGKQWVVALTKRVYHNGVTHNQGNEMATREGLWVWAGQQKPPPGASELQLLFGGGGQSVGRAEPLPLPSSSMPASVAGNEAGVGGKDAGHQRPPPGRDPLQARPQPRGGFLITLPEAPRQAQHSQGGQASPAPPPQQGNGGQDLCHWHHRGRGLRPTRL